MDARSRRLAVIAVLTAAVLPLGYLWMSFTSFTYAKLHLFVLAPIGFLYCVPPRPLSNVRPAVRQFGYTVMLLLSIVAVVYSVCGWDRILYKTGVIHCSTSFGALFYVPYEEWLWCADHTMLVCLWVMSIWSSRTVQQKRGDSFVGFRIVSTLTFLVLAIIGYIILSQNKNFFYIGLTLVFTCPIFALQFAKVGHIYLQYPREYIVGFVVPSVYVLAIDTLAMKKGIWSINPEFATGNYILGMPMEHMAIYTLTTALASQSMIGFLRNAEIYQTIPKDEKGASSIKSMVTKIWG